jgi:AraC-like DNA-binding protein
MSDAAAPLSRAVDRLWLPRLSLTACVRGVMSRDTRGVELNDTQRLNRFPASPLCSLSWWFHGESRLLPFGEPPGPGERMPGRFVFGGPHRVPTQSWCPGPAHAMMLVLLPDALHHLVGLDAERWVNRIVDAAEVLPPDWLVMCEEVQAAPDDAQRVRLIEDFLDPRWQAARPVQAMAAHRYADWAQGLALRAATSAPGRSLRQVERRIKQWAGQPMRELRGIARAEKAFFEALAAAPEADWAGIAAEGGYADQSHLCRETRRLTGFSPAELRRLIAEDESFWAYRLWG